MSKLEDIAPLAEAMSRCLHPLARQLASATRLEARHSMASAPRQGRSAAMCLPSEQHALPVFAAALVSVKLWNGWSV